jgi:hypothetical protein
MGTSATGPANLPPGTDVEAGPMTDRVIRRSMDLTQLQVNSDSDYHQAGRPSSLSGDTGRELDELADLVVERIEQRVIDELERRGRRGLPGAF